MSTYSSCYSCDQVNALAQRTLLALNDPDDNLKPLTDECAPWSAKYNTGVDYMRQNGMRVLANSLDAWHNSQVAFHAMVHASVGNGPIAGAGGLTPRQSKLLSTTITAMRQGTAQEQYVMLELCKRYSVLNGDKVTQWLADTATWGSSNNNQGKTASACNSPPGKRRRVTT